MPGIGAQGGEVDALSAAFAPGPGGGLVAASRSILYAWRRHGRVPTGGARGGGREAARLQAQAWRLSRRPARVSEWRDGELLRLHDEPRRRRGRHRFSIWTLVAPIALLASVSVIVVIARGAGWVGPDTEATIFTTTTGSSTSSTTTSTGGTDTTATRTTSNQTKIFYTIRSGDTLEAVAVRYGTTVQRLLVLNPGVNPNTLRIGQRIRLR